jgi:hypothetical protein
MSEQAKFTKIDDGSRQKAVNIKLKKEKKKGYFGKALVGAGNNDRYEGNVSFNHFNGDKQFSFLGNANNINKQGFSFSDIITAMGGFQGMMGGGGGGGGGIQMSGLKGGLGSMFSGSPGGITRSFSTGVNYNNYVGTKLKIGGNYFFSDMRNAVSKDIFRESFFPNDTIEKTEKTERYHSINTNQNHRANFRMEWQIDSMNSFLYTPSLTLQHSDGRSNDTSYTYSFMPTKQFLSVISNSVNTNGRDGLNLNNNVLFRHRFRKIGRTFTLGWSNIYAQSDGEGYNLSPNIFYNSDGSEKGTKNLDQRTEQETSTHNNVVSASYTEPIGKNKLLELNYAYTHNSNTSDKKTYDVDSVSGKYVVLNLPFSNYFENLFEANRYGMNFRVQKKKYNFQAGLAAQFATLHSKSYPATGKDTIIRNDYVNFFPTFNFNLQPSRAKTFRFRYNGRTNQPTLSQLQDVPDVTNPLLTKYGNPALKQEFNHNFNLGYNTFNILTFKFFAANINFNTTTNKIVDSTVGTGVQVIRPINMNGYYSITSFATFGIPFRKKLKGSSLNFTNSIGYNNDVNMVNGLKNIGKTLTVMGGTGLNFNLFKEALDFGLNANVTYYDVSYSVNTAMNERYFAQTYSADLTLELPAHIVLSSDFDYYINSGRSEGFNQKIPLWNAGIAKQFLKAKNAELKFSVNDILNQNQSITRTTQNNYIEDSRAVVLRRYFLVSFLYNLNKMGGKNANPMQGMPMPKMMERGMKNIRITQ